MSNLNKYAQRIDEYAKEAFKQYNEAEKAVKEAQQRYDLYPFRQGATPAYAAKSARYKADLEAAKEALHIVRRNMEGEKINGFAQIEKDFYNAFTTNNCANADEVNTNLLEILKADILTADEYKLLVNDQINKNNRTMARIIGKYAQNKAKEIGYSTTAAEPYRKVSQIVDNLRIDRQHTDAFNYLKDCFIRCMRNPKLINDWENLTSELIEKF